MSLDFTVETLSLEDEPPEQRWIWPYHIPHDKFTIVSGDWGAGKTHTIASIITSILRREQLPDGDFPACDPGHILIVTTESNKGELTRVFKAQGCTEDELNFIHTLGFLKDSSTGNSVMFDLDSHLPALIKQIEFYKPLIVMFDPLIEFHSRKEIDTKAIRSLMVMLNSLCEKYRFAGIGLLHWNKDTKAAYRNRTSGNHQYNAGVKAVIIVARDSKDKNRRIFVQEKMTLGPEPEDLYFIIDKPDGLVIWDQPPSATDPLEVETAKSWLLNALVSGPLTPSQCYEQSQINERTVRRARARLGPLIVTREHFKDYKIVQMWELAGPDNLWGLFELKTGKPSK